MRCDVQSPAPSLALFPYVARVRSAAWSLLRSICGVLRAPLLFLLHESKPASVCDCDSGPMKAITLAVVGPAPWYNDGLRPVALWLTGHIRRRASGTSRPAVNPVGKHPVRGT